MTLPPRDVNTSGGADDSSDWEAFLQLVAPAVYCDSWWPWLRIVVGSVVVIVLLVVVQLVLGRLPVM